MNINQFREKANIWLYGNKDAVLTLFRWLNLFISLLAVSVLIYYYGYPQNADTDAVVSFIIQASFIFYITYYLVKFVYDFHPLEFLKASWFQAVLSLLLVIEGISYNTTGQLLSSRLMTQLGFESANGTTLLLIQIYFLIAIVTELSRTTAILPKIKVHPAIIFIGSFSGLIALGTVLLMMPEMTYSGGLNLLDAVFTSTSASCVTGLMTLDTHTVFTFKGQFVLMMLMQIGGLNIIAFGIFLSIAAKFGVNVKQHEILEDFIHKESYLSATGLLTKVLVWCFGIELLGTLMLYLTWDNTYLFESNGSKWFHSLFHSISAFNNGGISTLPAGLYSEGIRHDYLFQWVIIVLIFVGGIGMMALFDMFSIESLRLRMKNRWRRISFSTKIALYYSLGLIVAGTAFFLLFEPYSADIGLFGNITAAVFQSVTARTAGFNTVDFNQLSLPFLLVMIALMFIGSSSGSTGGGIKTSTFALVMADVTATISGKKNTELFQRTISPILTSRAYSILVFFLMLNFLGILVLSFTERENLNAGLIDFMDVVFEQFSAVSTVGLSTGLTTLLSDYGKVIIILSMFIGRVGTLTVAFAVSSQLISKNYKYPEGHTMVG